MNLEENRVVTPLMAAAFIGDAEVLKALLVSGADLNATDRIGWTALTYAVLQVQAEIVRLLLEAEDASRAPISHSHKEDLKAIHQCTDLMKAAWRGDADAVTSLLNGGMDVNSKAAGGITALMFAAWSGRLATVQALLARGAEINTQTVAGSTPLMFAAATGHTAIVQVLLDGGATVSTAARNGRTAMMDAASTGHPDIVQLLQQAGEKEVYAANSAGHQADRSKK
jgi:ankyrin repeat protein